MAELSPAEKQALGPTRDNSSTPALATQTTTSTPNSAGVPAVVGRSVTNASGPGPAPGSNAALVSASTPRSEAPSYRSSEIEAAASRIRELVTHLDRERSQAAIIALIQSYADRDLAEGPSDPGHKLRYLKALFQALAMKAVDMGSGTFEFTDIRAVPDILWWGLKQPYQAIYQDLHLQAGATRRPEPPPRYGEKLLRQEAIGALGVAKGLAGGVAGLIDDALFVVTGTGDAVSKAVDSDFNWAGQELFDSEWSHGEELFGGFQASELGEVFGSGIFVLLSFEISGLQAIQGFLRIPSALNGINTAASKLIALKKEAGDAPLEALASDPAIQREVVNLIINFTTLLIKPKSPGQVRIMKKILLALLEALPIVPTAWTIIQTAASDDPPAEKRKKIEHAIVELLKTLITIAASKVKRHPPSSAQSEAPTSKGPPHAPGAAAPEAPSPSKAPTTHTQEQAPRPPSGTRTVSAVLAPEAPEPSKNTTVVPVRAERAETRRESVASAGRPVLSQRERVERSIAASKAAREASRFGQHVLRERVVRNAAESRRAIDASAFEEHGRREEALNTSLHSRNEHLKNARAQIDPEFRRTGEPEDLNKPAPPDFLQSMEDQREAVQQDPKLNKYLKHRDQGVRRTGPDVHKVGPVEWEIDPTGNVTRVTTTRATKRGFRDRSLLKKFLRESGQEKPRGYDFFHLLGIWAGYSDYHLAGAGAPLVPAKHNRPLKGKPPPKWIKAEKEARDLARAEKRAGRETEISAFCEYENGVPATVRLVVSLENGDRFESESIDVRPTTKATGTKKP